MGELLSFFLGIQLAFPQMLWEEMALHIPAQMEEISAPAEPLPRFSPVITAPSVFIADVASGNTLWKKNPFEPRAMASLTKLMTALIITEEHDFSEIVTVPREAVGIEGTSMYLAPGEEISVGNLLRGLLISSGNDAAETLAIFHSGSEEKFVEEMNRRALFLGMTETRFENPHGLDEEGHVSSAKDLSLLARKVLEFKELRTITNTRQQTVSSVDGKFRHELNTTNQLLASSFPVYGLKTGTTDAAGECLITLLKTGTQEIIIVVLGSSERFQDTKTLFWPFLES